MGFFNTQTTPISSTKSTIPLTHWEAQSPTSATDLLVKKIAVAAIAMLNLAALGAALYFIISYCPVPTEALIVSPFIVGVLGALAYMKFPTCGISSMNYTGYVNPVQLLGKAMAYLFFGPLMYAVKHLDWTPYHDHVRANRISQDLTELPFAEVADQYGKHFDNLIKYGFIHEGHAEELKTLYEQYKPTKKAIAFWKQEGLEKSQQSAQAKAKLDTIEEKWRDLKRTSNYAFPTPDMPDYDFAQSSTRVELWMRKYFCFNNPIDLARALET